MAKKLQLSYHKINPNAEPPVYGTQSAACFDFRACLIGERVKGFDRNNKEFYAPKSDKIAVNPGERILIPTGLILDIPEGWSVRLHARSGLSLKQGLVLANAEGVIDSDYVDPTYLMITNISTVIATVKHGDRIAQGELVPVYQAEFNELPEAPAKKTDREGGLGSTGIK
jgi:dUTP pyrophosphatase